MMDLIAEYRTWLLLLLGFALFAASLVLVSRDGLFVRGLGWVLLIPGSLLIALGPMWSYDDHLRQRRDRAVRDMTDLGFEIYDADTPGWESGSNDVYFRAITPEGCVYQLRAMLDRDGVYRPKEWTGWLSMGDIPMPYGVECLEEYEFAPELE